MGVESGRARVGELTFCVYQRALHPEWFLRRAHQRIAQHGWEADVWIVEGGHAIFWSSGKSRLSEVLCGPDTVLPDSGLLLRSTVRHERNASFRPHARCQYHACFEAERLEYRVFMHSCDEMILDARRGGLFYRGAAASRLAMQPLSYARIEPRVRSLLVHAVHTFPDEWAIVRTQTLIEWEKGE